MTPSQEAVELKQNRYLNQARQLVNDLFQDVDNQAKIPTNIANAICDVHARKFAHFVSQELQKAESKQTNDFTAFCDCGDSLERTGLYPNEATYYCMGCDETYVLKLVKGTK